MDYNYEALDEKTFQKLCQALIVAQYPNAQSMPVGQPDGGRDAFDSNPDSRNDGFTVFQVKFALDPKSKNARDAIQALIETELPKIKRLIERGATRYVFITNVSGTSHLDVGSIDTLNQTLTHELSLPSSIWWRDDIDRRLDNSLDIKFSFPRILRATDVLPLFLENSRTTKAWEAELPLKNYMATQYEIEKEVKFKQVDIKHRITDLFVDIPLAQKQHRSKNPWATTPSHSRSSSRLEEYIGELNHYQHRDFTSRLSFRHGGHAAGFLLQMPFTQGISRFVVEGAPGQGKSTVTQFICQVHRIRLLNKDSDLEKLNDEHRIAPLRLPFRIDMRDYSEWLAGRHPFSSSSAIHVPPEGSRSLESFIVMQMNWNSGSVPITMDSLTELLVRSHSVVVLDGFDEVADIAERKRVVTEVCTAPERFSTKVQSMQMVVTSRPSAFANSPGFPEHEWNHLELRDLNFSDIEHYRDKWIVSQRLDPSDAARLSLTLEKQLDRPHIRNLARNAMQLAILLHLMYMQGAALPDRRTALYDEYIKVFFNREAEKSSVVREYRNLLLSIHGFLAWLLHTQAEGGQGSGRIEKEKMRREVKNYLAIQDHDTTLVGELFKGTVERIGALVSRVQGVYEFEVQPLREYFAARYLYTTSRYSPVGHQVSGTRPDRFSALARGFYWTNVTRFFCGFYDIGELSGLVDGISELDEQDGYSMISGPRRLAMMLLSDHVFSEAPRPTKRLISFIVKDPQFYQFVMVNGQDAYLDLQIPVRAGRRFLVDCCVQMLESGVDPVRKRMLLEVITQNSDKKFLKSYWLERFKQGKILDDPLDELGAFRLLSGFSNEEIEDISGLDDDFRIHWFVQGGRFDKLVESPILYEKAIELFFAGKLGEVIRWFFDSTSVSSLEFLSLIFHPFFLGEVFGSEQSGPAIDVALDHSGPIEHSDALIRLQRWNSEYPDDILSSYTQLILANFGRDVEVLRCDLEPWCEIVDGGFDQSSSTSLIARVAVVAISSRADPSAGNWDPEGFKATKGLVQRLFYARHKCDDFGWWQARLEDCMDDGGVVELAVLVRWGEASLLLRLRSRLNRIVDRFTSEEWTDLWIMTRSVGRSIRELGQAISEDWFNNAGHLSARLGLLLLGRVEGRSVIRAISRKVFVKYNRLDGYMLRHAAEAELGVAEVLDNPSAEIDWEHISSLSRRARSIGLDVLWPGPASRWSVKVPKLVASGVLKDSDRHCPQVVAVCEESYAALVAESQPKILELAQQGEWFRPVE